MDNLFPGARVASEPSLSGGSDAGTSLRDVLLLLRRHLWLVVIGTCLGTAAAAALALRAEPRFTASATLVIDPAKAPMNEISAAAPSLGIDVATVMTQINVIRSRQHMGRVVEDLNLVKQPAFWQPEPSNGRATEGVVQSLLAWSGVAEPVQALLDRLPREWLLATGFAK